jgi:hypothetical protein
MAEPLPGKGLFGWFGRQFGYVKKAVKQDVAGPRTVYREQKVAEAPHPEDPNVKLRRTTIDEVIVDAKKPVAKSQTSEESHLD